MSHPFDRPRRLRQSDRMRALCRENGALSPARLVYPLFVVPGISVRVEIPSMPGCYHFSADEAASEARQIENEGIAGVILFGLPEYKDDHGSRGFAPDGVVQRAVSSIRSVCRDLLVITDVCLCEYTSHGHCGVFDGQRVLNDPTLPVLAAMALSHAQAGAHIVAPSDMMDGRVSAIRNALDDNGFIDTAILSYAVKYASSFYGPFREAADSAPRTGNRLGYQMDPANAREAIREAALDIEQGADIIMVKPALSYLDVIRSVRGICDRPLAAFNVSGEYSMVKAAAQRGWIKEREIVNEILTSIHRAGADFIITYHARDFIRFLG